MPLAGSWANCSVYRRDEWEAPLRAMGEYLGRFIYVMDAYDDLAADEKRGAYNPLTALEGEGFEQTVGKTP